MFTPRESMIDWGGTWRSPYICWGAAAWTGNHAAHALVFSYAVAILASCVDILMYIYVWETYCPPDEGPCLLFEHVLGGHAAWSVTEPFLVALFISSLLNTSLNWPTLPPFSLNASIKSTHKNNRNRYGESNVGWKTRGSYVPHTGALDSWVP